MLLSGATGDMAGAGYGNKTWTGSLWSRASHARTPASAPAEGRQGEVRPGPFH